MGEIKKGTVISGTNNVFEIQCNDGILRHCSIKGKRMQSAQRYYNPLAPGDIVAVEIGGVDENEGRIVELEERKNMLLRRNPKSHFAQIIAANIDCAVCVASVGTPPFRPRFVDRVLVQCDVCKIECAIIINKSDLGISDDCAERCKDWERNGTKLFFTSAQECAGLHEVARFLSGKSVAFVGQSGVGKSSLINCLCEGANQKTANLSEKYERGNHTTTCGRLICARLNQKFLNDCDGHCNDKKISLTDTPGIRSFLISDTDEWNLAFSFPEMRPLVKKCKFGASCTHTNEKNCAILDALKNGIIHPDRYESYSRIREELVAEKLYGI